jgi:hypothetical protein
VPKANGETDLDRWRNPPMARRSTRRFGLAIAAAAVVLSLSASAALAGEITGNGKSLEPLHANSICAYSGQNDDPTGIDPNNGPPGRTQNWGQIPKADRDFLTSIGVSPGKECRGGSL